MSFIDVDVKFNRDQESKFRRTEFMQLGPGAHIIRILEPQVKTRPTHYFGPSKSSVLCLGDECPICANNKKLIMQYPENFREQTGYNKVNWRFFINVFDKTPAKTCAKCGNEYKDTRVTICGSCGEVLPDAAPLNKVKVLSKGITLRDDLGSISKAILYPGNHELAGTPIPITDYDIILMVSGSGRDTKITPVPRTDANEPVPAELELFDLDRAIITLEPAEMLDLQRGVALKDIFVARRAKEDTFEPVADQETIDKVNSAVSSLFNQ